MASPTKTFLTAVTTAIALIEISSGVKAFSSVERVATVVDIVPRLQAQGISFPACVVADESGTPHPHNLKLENRRFAVVVAVRNMQDPQGTFATDETLDLCELVMAGDGTNPGQRQQWGTGTPIRSLAGPEAAPVGAIGANEIIYRTMFFEYWLQRS